MSEKGSPPEIGLPTPGIVWRLRKDGWLASWQARTDRVNDGYRPKAIQLWCGFELTEEAKLEISTRCQHQQFDMLTWGREVPPPEPPEPDHFTGTLRSLIHCYRHDVDSQYQKNRYSTRKWRDNLLRRVVAKYGDTPLSEIRARLLIAWHKDWSGDGARLPSGRSLTGQLRALFTFGATLLEDEDCERLCGVMHKMRFEGPKPRNVNLDIDHVEAICKKAREHFGWYSIALGQAFQFECTMRQKDVIGEMVPISEPGVSAVIIGDKKWLRGITWQEIDENLILRHVTSKKQKLVQIDLKLAPLVLAELQVLLDEPLLITDEVTKKVTINRHLLPASGPIVICDTSGLPWTPNEYRRKWRLVANACGVPKDRRNMDSRSTAITEAIQAGAAIELVRHAATHSDVAQTADYDRAQEEAIAKVMKMRVEARNRPKT